MKNLFGLIFLFITVAIFFFLNNFRNQVTLVFQAHPVFVLSLSPASKKMTILFIPDKTYIKAIHGYGSYRIESIFGLGQLKNTGGQLLQGSVQEYFGLPLDGYLSAGDLNFGSIQSSSLSSFEKKEKIKNLILQELGEAAKKRQKSNLDRLNLARIWWQIKKLRLSNITVVSLGQTEASHEVKLADGSLAIKIDPQRIDQIVKRLFQDNRMANEDLTVAVLNATSHPGLANQGARLISNLGSRVVEIGDWNGGGSICQLRTKKSQRKTYSIRKIKNLFHCRYSGEDLAGHRADIVIILGENYWQKLNK